MQSLYNMIFGQVNASSNLTSPAAQQSANTAFTQAYSAYQQGAIAGSNAGLAQQMSAQQYNNHLLGLPHGGYAQQHNPRPDWVFAGTPCRNAEEFADRMWPEACAEKTMFVLKWAGRTATP